jgi:hypothetical protein
MELEGSMARTRKGKRIYPEPGPSQCHPKTMTRKKEKLIGCLPSIVLKGVATSLGIHSTPDTHPSSLLTQLSKSVGVSPSHQRTFLNALPISKEVKEDLARSYLRPAQPNGWKDDPDMWLDTNNIVDVMKQYEESHEDFKFIGAIPIDFAAKDPYNGGKKDGCIINETCSLNLAEELARGITSIGIVFNLDPHYKEGSHWVASYISTVKKHYYYFDSNGMKPPSQIYRFMQWLTIQEPRMKLFYNGRRFQFKESECGMFCMYFIIRMKMGDSFRKFVRQPPPDSYMLDLRDHLYSD